MHIIAADAASISTTIVVPHCTRCYLQQLTSWDMYIVP